MLGRFHFQPFAYGILGAGLLLLLHLAVPSAPSRSPTTPPPTSPGVSLVHAQDADPKPDAEARPQTPPKPAIVNPIDGAELVEVPAGEFKMGSENGHEDEKPVHTVRLKAFRIYKTEVTNAQYAKFIEATGHRKPLYWDEKRFNAPKQPVVGVDWHDAVAYCAWARVRLPTEAEWEYAARGTDGREYPWGGEGGRRRGGRGSTPTAVRDEPLSSGKPAEVGSLPAGASPFGALDMAGNVWEWSADWYSRTYYAVSPVENPTGPAEGKQRVLRGGSWAYPSNVRAPYRFPERPTFRSEYVGFRCVQDIPATVAEKGGTAPTARAAADD